MKDAVSVIALFAAVIAVALLLGLAPGIAGAQSSAVVGTPTNLTATPGVGAVYLDWTPPANAEYHFVAWLPVDAVAGDFRIRPVGAEGTATIAGLTPGRTYFFTVIAGRWEWSAADFGAKWSGWSPWVTAPALSVPLEADPTSIPGVADRIESSSTSANATVKLTLTIGNLPRDMEAGSSIELYLEDDFNVPDSIDQDSVYFAVTNPRTAATNYGARVYATDPIEIDTDDHYGGNDDWAIQVFLPDFNTGDDFDGFQGPMQGQTLQLVILKSAGIKNPSEEGSHSVGYSVLGLTADANDGPAVNLNDVANSGAPLRTLAKISLSDEDNTRGYELTVTGSGFNNGTSAAVHVLHAPDPYPAWWDSTNCAEMNAIVGQSGTNVDAEGRGYCRPWARLDATQQAKVREVFLLGDGVAEATFCRHIILGGHRVGIASVGSDDTVAVEFEVTVPPFGPGNTNYLCMVDGEGRFSATDVERFHLEPTMTITPDNPGPRDYLTITGTDWPAGNLDGEVSMKSVVVEVYDDPSSGEARAYTVIPDAAGRFTVTHRVSRNVGIPSTNQVRATYGYGEIVKVASFEVPPAQVTVTPAEVQPGAEVTLSITGMPVYTTIDEITIGGTLVGNSLVVFRTDRNGDCVVTAVVPRSC